MDSNNDTNRTVFEDAMLDSEAAPVLVCPACGGRSIIASRDAEGCHAECACGFEAIVPASDFVGSDIATLERVFRGKDSQEKAHHLWGPAYGIPSESIEAQQRMAAAVENQSRAAVDEEKASRARQAVHDKREEELHPLRVAELQKSVEWKTATINCGRAQTVALNRIADALEVIGLGGSDGE